MAVVKVLPGGSSGGFAGPGREPDDGGATRGNITCWTAGSARRNIRWLWSILADDVPEVGGWAATLTLACTPDNSEQWSWALKRLFKEMQRQDARYVKANGPRADARGQVIDFAMHWVVEWTAAARPHLHMAVYSSDPDIGTWAVAEWFRISRELGWGAVARGQHVVPIEGVTGWLEYVSKHSARGVDHYQRQGAPEGWTRTGRLWGHRGTWPTWTSEDYDLADREFYRWRRLLVATQRAKLRRMGTPKAGYKRVGKSLGDRDKGRFAGVGYWVDAGVCIKLLSAAQDSGGSEFTRVADRLGDTLNGTHHTCFDPRRCRRLLRADDQLRRQEDRRGATADVPELRPSRPWGSR